MGLLERDIVVIVRNLIPPPLPILIAGLLAVSVAWSKNQDTAAESIETFSENAVTQNNSNILASVKPGDYSARIAITSERPLFSETRRNPDITLGETEQNSVSRQTDEPESDQDEIEFTEEEQIEEPPQPPRLSYLGYMEQDGTPSALIKLSEKNEEEWVYAGTEIEGWLLKSISKSRIYLTQRSFEHFVDINL